MGSYRAKPGHGVAWVTGASTGIGRALALDLAREGYTVAATAREAEPLSDLAAESSALPGRILPFPCDVTDEATMAATVDAIETTAGPIVLAIFNAGIYESVHPEDFDIGVFRRTYEVNVFGVLNGLAPALKRMAARSRGHVVLVGSITAFFGMPTTAAYGATKAALNNMAESLRYDLAKMNVRIQVINPGFVETALTARTEQRMHAVITPTEAARRMAAGIRSGGFEVTFPHRLTLGLRLLRLLPHGLIFSFVNLVTRWPGRPLMPGRKRLG